MTRVDEEIGIVTVCRSPRALRDYLTSADEAARLLYIATSRVRTLSRGGYINLHPRKGFYRLGGVTEGHAEAGEMQAIAAPHERVDMEQRLRSLLVK